MILSSFVHKLVIISGHPTFCKTKHKMKEERNGEKD